MSKGGTRWGAGRPGHKLKASHTLSIDVRRWQRDGLLNRRYFGWQWSDHDSGEVTSSIGVQAEAGRVTLIYQAGDQPHRDGVNINTTPCTYGGARSWFNCPRCNGRCAKLYLRWGHFRCRQCNQISYHTQSEDQIGRLWIAQAKIEARLGPNLARPKFMRHKTFDWLRHRYWQLEEQRDDAFCEFAARIGFGL